jgi:hypothetical protein
VAASVTVFMKKITNKLTVDTLAELTSALSLIVVDVNVDVVLVDVVTVVTTFSSSSRHIFLFCSTKQRSPVSL